MGTRADFYIGRGPDAEWLGSTAYDGYPDGIEADLLAAADEKSFRAQVLKRLNERKDGTKPEQGWPWPWDDSGTTDYAYAFDGECVWISGFGHGWCTVAQSSDPDYDHDSDDSKAAVFPDMSDRKNVAFDGRTGLLILGIK